MKTTIMILASVAMFSGIACADQYVNGYVKSNGTYVQGYNRSTPDNSYNNNYGTQGNTNIYTGEQGTSQRTYNDRTPDYNNRNYGNSGYETNTNIYGGTNNRKR